MLVVVHGTGSIGMRHLSVLRGIEGVEPVAMPVREERLGELTSAGWRTARSPEEAARMGARAAVVATGTGRHADDALAALAAGMHVLVEKPLCADGDGVSRVRAGARSARQVHVACNLRFHAGLARFRELVPTLGRVHAVRIECQSYLPDWRPETDHRQSYSASAAEGGVLRDLVHEVDYATWIFGRPDDVFARLTTTDALEIEAEEAADLSWQVPSGAVVSLRLDYLTRATRRRMTAFGEAGELEWDAVAQTVRRSAPKAAAVVESVPQDRDAMMRAQLEAFIAAADGGDPRTLATFEEGAFAVALCDAARASSRSGRTERIRPPEVA